MYCVKNKWFDPVYNMPEKNKPIVWLSPSGEEQVGKFLGVWLLDDGAYVYYTPKMWRYARDYEHVEGNKTSSCN